MPFLWQDEQKTGSSTGLVRHGRHEVLQATLVTLAANAYMLLRPVHPEVQAAFVRL